MKLRSRKIVGIFLTLAVMLMLRPAGVQAAGSPAVSSLATNGNGGRTDVGIWYTTYNNEKMWGNNFGSGRPIMYRALISRNPDVYGVPDSSNPDEIDMHLEMLAEAKIDFIVYDLTNGGLTEKIQYGWGDTEDSGNRWIVKNAKLTCQRIAAWNDSHDWKIKYALAVGTYTAINEGRPDAMTAELQAEAIYKEFFENQEFGGDNYYQLNGKPLLLLHDWAENDADKWSYYSGDRTYGDRFTIRPSQAGELGTYGWQTAYGTVPQTEVELICGGWCPADGEYTKSISRENGAYYKRNWDVILNNPLPRIVMISAFNDFNEHLALMPAESDQCTSPSEEKWTDETGSLNKTMYWDMTVEGIRQVRAINGELPGGSGENAAAWMYIVPIAITGAGVLMALAAAIIIVVRLKRCGK